MEGLAARNYTVTQNSHKRDWQEPMFLNLTRWVAAETSCSVAPQEGGQQSPLQSSALLPFLLFQDGKVGKNISKQDVMTKWLPREPCSNRTETRCPTRDDSRQTLKSPCGWGDFLSAEKCIKYSLSWEKRKRMCGILKRELTSPRSLKPQSFVHSWVLTQWPNIFYVSARPLGPTPDRGSGERKSCRKEGLDK